MAISAGGRVALETGETEAGGQVAILDLAKCTLRRTGIHAPFMDADMKPYFSSFSDDGARLLLTDENNLKASVFDLAGDRLIAACTMQPAGGPDPSFALSGDGKAIVWRHGRSGTWVQPLAGCKDDASTALLRTDDAAALVSPHLRFSIECPHTTWAQGDIFRGYTVRELPGGRLVSRLAAGVLAPDEYGLCGQEATALSPDDRQLALYDGRRVHVFTLRDGRERVQISKNAIERMLSEDPAGLAFSPSGDELAMWSSHNVAVFALREYEAYARATPVTQDDEQRLFRKAVRAAVDVGADMLR
jgi:hypothetical protein